jgi:hypothetical protein
MASDNPARAAGVDGRLTRDRALHTSHCRHDTRSVWLPVLLVKLDPVEKPAHVRGRISGFQHTRPELAVRSEIHPARLARRSAATRPVDNSPCPWSYPVEGGLTQAFWGEQAAPLPLDVLPLLQDADMWRETLTLIQRVVEALGDGRCGSEPGSLRRLDWVDCSC